jgi:virulence plasmid B protein/glycosyltransferase TcdB-like subunit of Tc toxin/VCBS repeat protein
MNDKAGGASQVISLPQGGGALHGIGEKFSPDLHTGTGNFTVPIALPPGRNGFQPQLDLVYSTGNGNGPFGLGWSLNIPGVSRKTSKGVPRYQDETDVFVLSGAEDLVGVKGSYPGRVQYRPRTEGLFALIEHLRDAADDYWEVRSKDGLISTYGTPATLGLQDGAAIGKGDVRKFAWKLSQTRDPFGNRIVYDYISDQGMQDAHEWNQPLLNQIRYVDYEDSGHTKFLVSVAFAYEDRLDPFSDYRAGFEIRLSQRCAAITVTTHADQERAVRRYRFEYEYDSGNGVSLLKCIHVIGFDDDGNAYDAADGEANPYKRQLPPLEFGYTRFEPAGRKFQAVTGADLPAGSLANPDMDLVDLFGDGLPDILEMNGTVRYWRNLGGGRYDLPRPMRDAPPHALSDPGVQILDANGDGRLDLMVTNDTLAGYYPMAHNASWDRRSFQRYKSPPTFSLEDPEVRLIDLDGDGVTDAIRSGTSLECAFNDPRLGWSRIVPVHRKPLEVFPNVNFSDPRVKFGDMTGDGMQDIVLVYDGNIEYWPNLGYGNWGRRIHMRNSPRFKDAGYTFGYDPRRILLGDVDGDGCADIIYVGDGQVTLWLNQSGNRWSDPIEISGTPPVPDMGAVRLVDLLGGGISGVLWSSDAASSGRPHMYFLDFTGGVKPYLLNELDNHLGARTKVEYCSSTRFYLEDRQSPQSRWRTVLPFPVQVVARVEVIDRFSRGKLTTAYRYHHGYWDGAEREFRGFGMVEQLDTETFEMYREPGLHGPSAFVAVDQRHFSSPTLTRTWFHQGPVEDDSGEWYEQDLSGEYWAGDPPLLDHTENVNRFLRSRPDRFERRDALRTLRGSILRSELYALIAFRARTASGRRTIHTPSPSELMTFEA